MDCNSNKKMIKVTCAIIENHGQILAAQRSEKMNLPLKWEFPGGKIEAGESPEASIVREIREELDIDVEIVKALKPYIHDYGNVLIELIPFICRIERGNIKCREHKNVVWANPCELSFLEWAEADVPVYKEYIKHINSDL